MLTWNPLRAELDLAHRDLIRLSGNHHSVTCHSGLLWITLDYDARDILLEPGQGFTTSGSVAAVVYALAPTRLTIEQHGPRVASARPARRARTGSWAPTLQQLVP